MLKLKNLKKIYKNKRGKEVKALDGVSLEFPEKGLVFILGKSGSGKSTLLNVCGGLDKPDEGEVIIDGCSTATFSRGDYDGYRNTFIGFVFQEYNLLEEISVEDNVALALELQGKSRNKELTDKILDKVGLKEFADNKAKTLSGGQKQRVAIARALIKNPQVILADEPTGALDEESGKQILSILKKLSEEKLIIVVSHEKENAKEFGDRIIELHDGKVVKDETKVVDKKGSVHFLITKDEDCQKELITDEKSQDLNKKKEFLKSKLPSKYALKLGLNSIKAKPIRFICSIILCAFAFMFFGVCASVIFFDADKATYNVLAETNEGFLNVTKKYETDYNMYLRASAYSTSHEIKTAGMTQADIDKLSEKGKVTPVYSISSNITLRNLNFNKVERIYSSQVQGIINDTGGLEYIIGRSPMGNEEVAISEFLWESIKNGKLYDKDGNIIENDGTLDNIKIRIGGTYFDVSGVFKGMPMKEIKYYEATDAESEKWLSEWANDLRASEAFYSYVAVDGDNLPADIAESINIIPMESNYFKGTTIETLSTSFNEVRKLQKGQTFYTLSGSLSTYIGAENKYIVPSWVLFEFIEDYAKTHIEDIEDVESFMPEYEQKNIEHLLNEIINSYAEISLLEKYAVEVLSFFNKYFPDVRDNFVAKINGNVCESELIGYFWDIEQKYFPYLSLEMLDEYRKQSLNSEGLEEEVTEFAPKGYENAIYSGAFISTLGFTAEKFETLLKDTDSVDEYAFYSYLTPAYAQILSATKMDNQLAAWLLYIGLGIMFFAVLLLVNFISVSVSNKNKELSILRALGTRGKDILRIFIVEAIIVAVFTIILAIIGAAIFVGVDNANFAERTGLQISTYNFSIGAISLIIGIALITAILATVIPVMLALRKSPADGIRLL